MNLTVEVNEKHLLKICALKIDEFFHIQYLLINYDRSINVIYYTIYEIDGKQIIYFKTSLSMHTSNGG